MGNWQEEFVEKFCPYNGEYRLKCKCSLNCDANEDCEYNYLRIFIKNLLKQEKLELLNRLEVAILPIGDYGVIQRKWFINGYIARQNQLSRAIQKEIKECE